MPITELLNDLLASDTGQFVACNILDAVEQNVLDRAKAKESLIFCCGLYDASIKSVVSDETRHKKTYALFHKLFSNPAMRFQANIPPDGATQDEPVSWVTPFKALAGHYINFSKVSAHLTFTDDTDYTPDKMKAAIKAFSSAEAKPAAIMRGYVETWWHTKSETFDAALNKAKLDERADRARDWLGLIHHIEGTALVAITIPAKVIAGATRVKRPTFVEAGDHPRFRSWSDSAPLGWGRAVDLLAFDGVSANTFGGEERVASPMPFPDLDTIDADFLGIVSNTHEEALSDCIFLPLILRGRTMVTLRKQLEQLAA